MELIYPSINHYLVLATILFTIGLTGIFLNRKNVINILMCFELILLSVNLNFVAFSALWGNLLGQVFVMFILTVAAAEVAVGLTILIVFFRNSGDISINRINQMKG